MTRLPELLGRLLPRSRPEQAAPAPAEASRPQKLLDSGVFDQEFYSASVGVAFESPLAAATHCVRRGLRQGHSPHPLLDIGSVPREVQSAWRAGKVTALLGFLRGQGTGFVACGPLFDAAAAPGSREEKRAHPGGALGHFLQHADEHTPLPVPEGCGFAVPRLGEARRRLLERVRETEAQRRLTGSRTSSTWDFDAEAAWKQRWARAELPTATAPLVTVVTPVHNRPTLVARAIESVQAQQLESWELVVVDDGSTDGTAEVVQRYAAADPRIRLLRQPRAGVSAARNRGLAEARGEFLAFLDSDNTWAPDFLRLAVLAMHHDHLRAAHAASRLLDPASGRVRYRDYDGGLDALLVMNHVDLNTLVVRADLAAEIGGFDERLRRWVDHDFVLRLARCTDVPLLPFLACDYDNSRSEDRITHTEHESWQYVVLGRHWVDWPALRAAERDASLVSVVVPTYQDWRMTVRAVREVLQDADRSGLEVEVVVVDNGSAREVGTQLVAAFAAEPRARYLRLPRNLHFAIGCNVGFAHSRGSVVVFLNNDTMVRSGWLSAMLPRLEDPAVRGVQPLLLYPDDTIQTAGTIFAAEGFLPTHLLTGHPPEDAERLRDRPFPAATAAALAVRAEEFAELEGFDPVFVNGSEDVDLCLRATERFGGGFAVETRARVTHFEGKTPGRGAMIEANRQRFIERWRGRLPAPDVARYEELGFTVAHLATDGVAVPAARPIVIKDAPDLGVARPRLRWGFKLPAIAGPLGDLWGDTFFASSLSGALRALGQDVVTYRHGTHNSSTSHLDDVVLGIRGLDVIVPQPGKLNILWVISHPEDVDPEELTGFDLVYAASEPWSREMGRRAGRPVLPLHQAVDVTNLPAAGLAVGSGEKPVFVGATHAKRTRKTVLDAIEAGVDLVIHGHGWEETPAAPLVVSEHLPNHQVLAVYREHGLVLADHWPDMAAHGFVANRVFDAVAAGARVVSDAVPGIEELFGGAVRVYRDVEDLRHLCSVEGRAEFPGPEELAEVAARVAREHSFHRRAEVLLDAAVEGLRARAAGLR